MSHDASLGSFVSFRRACRRSRFAGLRAVCLCAWLLFAGVAAADPVVALQAVQQLESDHSAMYQRMQVAYGAHRRGDDARARQALMGAADYAVRLSGGLAELRTANQDTLDRGLYRDRVALERALADIAIAEQRLDQLIETLLAATQYLDPTSFYLISSDAAAFDEPFLAALGSTRQS
ncbi:hypothetical protein SAMN04487939_10516 [Lysobacter sp. yr284]|nr:hypothetical protein SAMN04487939_10516 [Lysobacter sp. yr284]